MRSCKKSKIKVPNNICILILTAIMMITLNSGCLEAPKETLPESYITTSTMPYETTLEQRGYAEAPTTTSTIIVPSTTIPPETTIYTTTTTLQTPLENPTGGKRLTIASWNIQRFGPTKASNTDIVKFLASKINDYDIVVLEEITDQSGAAFNKLCTYLNDYKCIASDRTGNSTYKEQYGIIYKDAELTRNNLIATNSMERFPLWLTFKSGNWTFNLVVAHTKPTDDKIEMMTLDYILNQPTFRNDTILIGDLNADCSYYSRDSDFSSWLWAIPDGEDTTVGASHCAYDRIIINSPAQNNFYKAGVMKEVTPDISDHYLIYGVFDNSVP